MRLSHRLFMVGILVLSLGWPADAAGGVRVVFVSGRCEQGAGKGWQPLKRGDVVAAGRAVRTGADGRAELAFGDGTVARLAPKSQMTIAVDRSRPGGGQQSFLRLALGRVWARVTKGRGQFGITGPTAVAAVTGTTFRLDAAAASTAAVVYEGGVGIQQAPPETPSAIESLLKTAPAPSPTPAPFGKPTVVGKPYAVVSPPMHVVAGPHPVSREAWLQLIANQQVVVGADGVAHVSDLEPGSEAGDEWVQWNQARDRVQTR